MHVFSNALRESTNLTHLSALNRKFSPSSSTSRKRVGCKTRDHISDRKSSKSRLAYLDDRVCSSTSSPFLPTPPYQTADILGRSSLFLVPSLVCAVISAYSWVATIRYPLHPRDAALQRFRPEGRIGSPRNDCSRAADLERNSSWSDTE